VPNAPGLLAPEPLKSRRFGGIGVQEKREAEAEYAILCKLTMFYNRTNACANSESGNIRSRFVQGLQGLAAY
jgi:hypothetical protein